MHLHLAYRVFKPDPAWAPATQGDSIQKVIGTSGSACSLANSTCDRVSSSDSPHSPGVGDDDAGVVIYTSVNLVIIPQYVSVAVLLLVKMYYATEDRWGWYVCTGDNTATGTRWGMKIKGTVVYYTLAPHDSALCCIRLCR